MTQTSIQVREYIDSDKDGLLQLLSTHMSGDSSWPPRYAREEEEVLNWVSNRSSLGRWVALLDDRVVGHMSADLVNANDKEDAWTAEINCAGERLAEIGRLVVHPEARRAGISGPLTRRCVRDVVEKGYVPVATAFRDAAASQAMMTKVGWRVFAEVTGRKSGKPIVLLRPPQQLVVAALSKSPTGQL